MVAFQRESRGVICDFLLVKGSSGITLRGNLIGQCFLIEPLEFENYYIQMEK